MQRDRSSLEVLLRGLRAALLTIEPRNPNRRCLEEAVRYTERSRNGGLGVAERAALLRTAAKHLRHADITTEHPAENELLGAVRRAMTAVLFEYAESFTEEAQSDAFEQRDPAADSAAATAPPAPPENPETRL